MKRGEVVRVDLPRPNGAPGREQFGLRPAIIVQDEPRFANLATVLIVPLTSNRLAEKFSGSITIHPTKSNGLSVASVALTQQIRAVDRKRIQDTLGDISADDLAALDTEIRLLLRV